MERIRKEMREVVVVDYYAEMGDVITIPGKRGQFVVEEALMTDGGGAQGGDEYPNAWHVKARSLRKKRSDSKGTSPFQYNPNATLIEFTQHTNCYNDVINGVEKIGKMEKVVNFQWVC